jgi:hypothetical protein
MNFVINLFTNVTMKTEYLGKALATCVSALICTYLLQLTNGEHGIGWFIVSLMFIW